MDDELRTQSNNRAALLVMDMINRFDFEGADALVGKAREAAKVITRLRREMNATGSPVIYVNDNFDEWHSDRSRLIASALDGGRDIARIVEPAEGDFFVIKPQFSGFYATNLAVLLPKLGVSRLILTGVATDICVLFTAADAHMRDYDIWVPADAVAAECDKRSQWALEIMRNSLGAHTEPTDELTLAKWLSNGLR
ncbi:cysteine hydrolase family protein [Novosphingobium sp. ZW T3_23]|uniref:cysteine hydrolase family protein n=1 Tax=Novosphingobium sp. ZW T3_23 TaxID=3378084 RepID=UPI00385202F3